MKLLDRARELAGVTPPSRNRYVDLLRAVSITVVVLGHWLMAVITVEDGKLVADHLLAAQPLAQVLTWFFQVMPIFFIVGGYSNAASWTAALRSEKGYANWLRNRCQRLLGPTAVFAIAWVPIMLLATRLVPDPATLELLGGFVAVPLWFLAVYLLVVPLAPLMWSVHRRLGVLAPLLLMVAAGLVDAFLTVPPVDGKTQVSWGFVNYAFVWLAVHQLGYLWYDGKLRSRTMGWGLLSVGLIGMVALTVFAGYAFSMIGVPGADANNNTPPSVMLIFLSLVQMGLILLTDGRANRWLAKREPWARTIVANGMIMTMFLWHLTALVLTAVAGLLLGVRFPNIEPLGAMWWLSRLGYLALLAVVLLGFVAVFGRFERPRPPDPVPTTAGRALTTGVAAVAAGLGLAGLAFGGFYSPNEPWGVPVLVLGLLLGGAWFVGVQPRVYRRG